MSIKEYKEKMMGLLENAPAYTEEMMDEEVGAINKEYLYDIDVQAYMHRVNKTFYFVTLFLGKRDVEFTPELHRELMLEILTDAQTIYVPSETIYPKRFIDNIIAEYDL